MAENRINNVNVSAAVVSRVEREVEAEANQSNEEPKESEVIKHLKQEIEALTKKMNAVTCCQPPFEQALGNYLNQQFTDFSLIKRI